MTETLPLTTTKRNYRGRTLRAITRIAAVLLIVAVTTLVLGAKAKADLVAKYPPTGQMIDVGRLPIAH
ncbi:MAG: hypothetical protein ABI700_11640 [Chloroflexota bacterium]